jgi:hypothetical protein
MSKYDNERKKLGIQPISSTTAVKDRPKSKYDGEREKLKNPVVEEKNKVIGAFNTKEELEQIAANQPKESVQPKEEQLPGRDIPILGNILGGLDVVGEKIDPFADFARSMYTPGAGLGNVTGAYNAVGAGLNRIAPKLGNTLKGRIGQEAIKESVIGAPIAAGQTLASGQTDLGEVTTQGAIGGAVGAVGGAAMPVIGVGVRSALQKLLGRSKQPEAIQEILTLPEPKQRGNTNKAQTPDVINIPETSPRALPEPNIQPTVARRGAKEQNVYVEKLQRLFDEANALDQQGELSPGRELEEVESLWSRMANKDDPGLDELINLANPKHRGINPNALTKGRSSLAAGAGPNVKDTTYKPFAGQADAPVEKVGFNRKPVKNIEEVQTVEPVQSKYAAEREAIQTQPAQPISKYATERKIIQATAKPKSTEGTKERGFATTVKEADKTASEVKEGIKSRYTPVTNEESLRRANQRIDKDIEAAASYVMGTTRTNAEKIATGSRLIDEFTKRGQHQRAVDIAEKLAEEGTKAGQSIQSFSMYERLSTEGILIHANRLAQKTNEMFSVNAKQVKVTDKIAAQIGDLVQTSQRLSGAKDLSSDVVELVNRAKKGEKLSEVETDTIRRFVEEARQFAKETSRKSKTRTKPARIPNEMKTPRVRDNVVSFLDAQEKAAKERLRAKGFRVSSTPLDVYADYAIIGAAKLGRGTIKFADWSESMVNDFGEEIKPMLNAIYERSKDTLNITSKRVTSQTIDQAERITNRLIKSKDMTLEEAESLKTLALNVSGLSGDAKRIASQDLQAVLQGLDKPTKWQQIDTAQTIFMLLNPKTMIRNIGGNELFYRLERINKYVATPIDWGRVKLFGGQRSVTFRTHNQGRYWEGFIQGAQAGWKGVNPEGLTTQFDLRPSTFSGKYNPMTYLEKALGASLRGFDYAGYRRAVNKTLGELGTLKAINEKVPKAQQKEYVEKFIKDADDNTNRIADEYGKYATFQDNNVLSVGLQRVKRGLNKVTTGSPDFGIGSIVLKFPRTPGALLMRAIEYSPIGFARSLNIFAKPFYKKGTDPNQAEVMQAFSRAIVGTGGLSGLGYFLLDKGIMTGSSDKDRDTRELERSAGKGQYQVNISALKRFALSAFDPSEAKLKVGDSLITYDWAQPVAIAISLGANVKKAINAGNQKDPLTLGGIVYQGVTGGVDSLVEQSVLQGIKRAGEGYYGQTMVDKIGGILGDVPASFVPTFSNQIRQYADNTQRETYDPDKLKAAMNRMKLRVPGLSGTLPQRYDTLGKPKENFKDSSNSLFNVFFNPSFVSKYTLSPEAKFVIDLIDETGDKTAAPRVPGKNLTIRQPNGDAETIKLTPTQYTEMQKIAGEYTMQGIQMINEMQLTNDQKLKAMSKILNNAGELARYEIKQEMGVY